MLLSAKGMTKAFGAKEVLRNVDLEIEAGDRIGLVGPNGTGKTTLLKILTGEIKPDTGELTVRTAKIAYLPQFHGLDDETLDQVLKDPFAPAELARLEELERLMSSAGDDPEVDLNEVAAEYARLQEELTSKRGYIQEERKEKALVRLGLTDRPQERRINELSGGEATRVMLARVLVQADEAEMMILDEPTSHLDIETTESLEDFLRHYPGAVLVVSHDRYFLDRVVKEIWDLDSGTLTKYRGSYTEFAKKKELELEKQRIAYHKNQTERERNLKIAEEQHLRLKYATTHKTRLKMVDRMEEVDAPRKEKKLDIRLQAVAKSGKNVLTVKGFTVRRGGRRVLENIDLEIVRGDRLGIFGANGSGKTTLLLALIGELGFEGEYWLAPGARWGYFAQGHDGLDSNLTPEQQLEQMLSEEEKRKARGMLAQFLFTPQQVKTPIANLSGGERAKVALAMLTSEKSNLLFLDEPTNYLDLPSREAVERALIGFPETLVLVTHDRYLLDVACNKVADLRNGRMRLFNGTYSEMKRSLPPSEVMAEAGMYRVVSGFTDWATRTKYRPGDKVGIAPSEVERFRWALDAGKLKKGTGKELKKVQRNI
ncbi:MAG: ABC-F family ATP-binding cassette domain-containing protein [Methanomassiliicoccales archaeon]|nr:ABC-F family ATP-binding cassette domain-containing protein [Methanomassiliicoccales archaeon]